jgi:hypothetical protein
MALVWISPIVTEPTARWPGFVCCIHTGPCSQPERVEMIIKASDIVPELAKLSEL